MKNEDAEQLEKTVARERPGLLSFIRRRVRVSEDAQDILQDVLQQLLIS
ncbi:MAG: DNA-directed RNA polymerase specialized sigma24 family protein [Candidatus Azotimanducaceae bacterium]|jgi:DNA-directed RNA polymerase specialized sigma24 family protein